MQLIRHETEEDNTDRLQMPKNQMHRKIAKAPGFECCLKFGGDEIEVTMEGDDWIAPAATVIWVWLWIGYGYGYGYAISFCLLVVVWAEGRKKVQRQVIIHWLLLLV